MTAIDYQKGPLGFAVVVGGKAVGSIRDRRPYGWAVALRGHTFPTDPKSVAGKMGVRTSPITVCRTLADAKRLVERSLNQAGASAPPTP
jgi:hypothetical protein